MTNRRGQQRRRALVTGSVLIAIAATLPFVHAAHASPNPSSNIGDYVLYSQSTIDLKYGAVVNGNIAAGESSWQNPPGCSTAVPAGTNEYQPSYMFLKSYSCSNYGSYGAPSAAGNVHTILCQGSNATLTMPDPQSYVVAPSTDIAWDANKCNVPNVYTLFNNDISPPSNFHMPSNNQNFTPPNIVMPSVPMPVACGTKVTYTAATLPPGTYGNYDFSKSTTLSAGTYTFCNLTVEQNATLNMASSTVVNVQNNLNFIGGSAGHVGDTVGNAMFYVAGTIQFGRNGQYFGTFIAPHDDVALGDTTVLTGRVWAWALHSDKNITINPPPVFPPPPTSTSTSTTTVKPTSTSTSTTTIKPTTTTSTSTSTSTSTTAPTSTTTTTNETTFTF